MIILPDLQNERTGMKFILRIADILRKIVMAAKAAKFRIKKAAGLLSKPIIQPYYGYGNQEKVFVHGRVVENNVLSKPLDKYRAWDNIIALYKRYVSDYIPNVRVSISLNGQRQIVCADKMGYFDATFPINGHMARGGWMKAEMRLLDKVAKNQKKQAVAIGRALISDSNSQFGIISDVDDTILISRATRFIKKFRLLLLKNAHTRLPFEGVAAFYHALQKGGTGAYFNPIFYVSSSSWKLYDLLVNFCKVKGIPRGPFFLRSSRLDQYKFLSSLHRDHKLGQIEKIMSMYPGLKFILIGDSGQKDPEIYTQVVKDFPGRVEAIFIRDVTKKKRDIAIQKIGERLFESEGVELVYTESTSEAAKYALSKGYITRENAKEVIREKIEDSHATDDPGELAQAAELKRA